MTVKFSGYAKKSEADYNKHKEEQEVNFMGGISYSVNPLLELRMVAASSIFGESSYYKDSGVKKVSSMSKDKVNELKDKKVLNTTTESFIKACDSALDYDFKGTLELAKELRKEYLMRLNPALIAVRAAMHKNRAEFNAEHKDFMKQCLKDIINIPTDIWNQFELWMFFNGSKNKLPTILKKVWADKLAATKKYQLAKYKTTAHIIDLVRICHANSESLNELMKTGNIVVTEEESTWEKLRSQKKKWEEIFESTYVPHMAILRNLRGIFTESDNKSLKEQVLKMLEDGVPGGKQFPFRYYTAKQEIEKAGRINFKSDILDCLERCMDKAMENFPKLKGKTICLSDNSGSAWGTFNSEYGSVVVANIDNLSSIMTCINSEEGEIGIFGDRLEIVPINKRDGVLSQLERVESKYSKSIGGSTENGIWLFFRDAIKNKSFYDRIVIYSDMQAGHGGLYGIRPEDYSKYKYGGSHYIDVLKLVQEYRRTVNPKVNVFSVQTAGYKNSVVPENEYRTSILTGWTGKEAVYMKAMEDIWNQMDGSSKNNTKEVSEKEIKVKTYHK